MNILLEAFLLGLVGGVVPGSILTILLVSVLQGGYRFGLRAFGWSLAAELTIVSLLLVALLALPFDPVIFTYLGLIGGGVLFYFAWQIFGLSKIDQPKEIEEVFSSRQIYTLAATNAPLYIFWVTVCAPLIWQLAETMNLYLSAVYFMLAFELGWALSTFVIMLVFMQARSVLTNTAVMRKVFVIVALFMAALGVRMVYSSGVTLGII